MPTRAALKRRLSGKSLNPFREVEESLENNPTTTTTQPGKTQDLNAPGTSREARIRAALRKQQDAKSKFKRSSTNKGKS